MIEVNDNVVLFQKTGDSTSYDIIMSHAYRLADSIIYQKHNKFGYYDDLKSVAHDAIIKCINSFDISKGNFTTYCYKVIERDIVHWIKKYNKSYSIELNESISGSFNDGGLLIEIREAFSSLCDSHKKSLIGDGGSRWSNQRAVNKFAKNLGYA